MEELNREVMAKAVAQNRKNLGLPPQKDAVAGRSTLMFSDCYDHGRHAFASRGVGILLQSPLGSRSSPACVHYIG